MHLGGVHAECQQSGKQAHGQFAENRCLFHFGLVLFYKIKNQEDIFHRESVPGCEITYFPGCEDIDLLNYYEPLCSIFRGCFF